MNTLTVTEIKNCKRFNAFCPNSIWRWTGFFV